MLCDRRTNEESDTTGVGARGREELIEGGGEGGVAEVLEHVGDLARGDAGERERGEMVFGEELRAGSFVAVLGSAALEFGEEENFVGVEGVRGMALQVAVEKRGKFGDAHFVAGFFADFASGGDGGRLADVGPAAGEGPAAVLEFANKEDAVLVEGRDAHVDFGSGVAGLMGEEVADGSEVLEGSAGGHHFGGDGANFFVALDVELVFAIGETGLRNGLEASRPGKPGRNGHGDIVA